MSKKKISQRIIPAKSPVYLDGPKPRISELAFAWQIFVQFIKGFRTMHFAAPCITVFGSARFDETHKYYIAAREFGKRIAEMGFATLTGGGPGIMEAAHRGAFYNAHYSSTKGALISLTRSLSRELGPATRVNAVSPGMIDTPMARDLIRDRGQPAIDQTPLKRVGQPGEIASVIAFLCSEGASFITGEVINANGGLHMAG